MEEGRLATRNKGRTVGPRDHGPPDHGPRGAKCNCNCNIRGWPGVNLQFARGYPR